MPKCLLSGGRRTGKVWESGGRGAQERYSMHVHLPYVMDQYFRGQPLIIWGGGRCPKRKSNFIHGVSKKKNKFRQFNRKKSFLGDFPVKLCYEIKILWPILSKKNVSFAKIHTMPPPQMINGQSLTV